MAHRTFENGLIVLNDSQQDQSVEVELASGFRAQRLLDPVHGATAMEVCGRHVTVTVPAKRARVYVASND